MNTNCFVGNYLVENRVEKHYNNFIETVYGFSELTKSVPDFEGLLKLPYPVFRDYLNILIKAKQKEAKQQQNQLASFKK